MTREEFVGALRRVADLYEAQPIPVPYSCSVHSFAERTPAQAKEDVGAFLRGGRAVKADDGDYMKLSLADLPANFELHLFVHKDALGCRKVQAARVVVEEKWEGGPLLEKLAEAQE